jgi:hypothetical protein
VAGKRGEGEAPAEFVPGVHEVGEARLQDGDDAVLDSCSVERQDRAGLALRQPPGELLAAEQIAGVGEGRHEAAVGPAGVPADVVDVEMGAEDHVDGGRLGACLLQPVEKAGGVALVPHRQVRAVPVVADAAADEDGAAAGADDERLHRELQPVAREVQEVRLERCDMLRQPARIQAGQKV